MANYYQGDRHPLLSAPIPVHSFGWRSDTVTLQRAGWMFSIQYEESRMCYNLALKHRSGHMCALSFGNRIEDHAFMHAEYMKHGFPPIELNVMGGTINFNSDRFRGQQRYDAIDMEPTDRARYMEEAVHRDTIDSWQNTNHIPFEMYCLFKPVEREQTKTKEILIEERSIGELMGIIKERYASSDQEYYEQQVDGESVIISDQHEVKRHLQLVSKL